MLLRALTDPFYLARRALTRCIARHAIQVDGLLVDIGCGVRPYQHCFAHCRYVGLEVTQESPHGSARRPDVQFDGRTLPLRDGSTDAILCTQVLEHVFEPSDFLSELRRVLKPGGRLLLTVPFVWDEHEQPFDYARYTSFGLRHLLQKSGFRVLVLDKTLPGLPTLGQLLLCWAHKQTHRWPRLPRVAVRAMISLPVNLLSLIAEWLPTATLDLYLDNVVLCERDEA